MRERLAEKGLRYVDAAARGDNPDTGASWDDTKRYVDKAGLSAGDLREVYELNARCVYPRLDSRLAAAGR
jgi:4-oxalmesaconate hydratase